MVSKAVILLILNAIFFGFIVFSQLLCFLNAICLSMIMVSMTLFSQWDGNILLMILEYFGKSSDSLKGKVIWITGASTGIGKACAIKFAQEKCRIVLSSRNKSLLEDVKKQCIEAGNLKSDDVLVLPFDITHSNLHVQSCESVLEHFGELDILLSNAGASQRCSFISSTVEVDSEIYNLNVFGPVNLARVVTKYFLTKKKGQHLVVSSVAGKLGSPNSPSYSGTKFALHGVFESLRAEHGASGIAITMLAIGPVESNLMQNVYRSTLDDRGGPERKGKLMTGRRCADLICLAAVYKLPEVYIVEQPLLTVLYVSKHFYTLYQWYLNYHSTVASSSALSGFTNLEDVEIDGDKTK